MKNKYKTQNLEEEDNKDIEKMLCFWCLAKMRFYDIPFCEQTDTVNPPLSATMLIWSSQFKMRRLFECALIWNKCYTLREIPSGVNSLGHVLDIIS